MARPSGVRFVFNQYLIEDGARKILLDTGPAGSIGQTGALPQAFAALGLRRDQIDAVIVTHMHEDHMGGLIVGGAYGEGALRIGGVSEEYYSVAAASIGFQIGVQTTKQALFFMTEDALARFRRADGWEAGVDAEVTFPGAGVNVGTDTTVRNAPIVGIVFGEDGLMAGASLQGSKYSRVNR